MDDMQSAPPSRQEIAKQNMKMKHMIYEQTNDLKCLNDYKIYVISISSLKGNFVCKMYANHIRGLPKLLSMRVLSLRKGSSPATSINLRVGETLILQRFSYF